ncbi:MAG: hypothetical protein JWQ94_4944 [Tardiphaga sp.]|jgi:hypothetical protein|nr:hypothetical protein [Tardiphaga sp.]
MSRAVGLKSAADLSSSKFSPPGCRPDAGDGCEKRGSKEPTINHHAGSPGTLQEAIYLPTDISPETLFQAIGRLRQEAQDEIERLRSFLNETDGDADLEPSLAGHSSGMDDREGHDDDTELRGRYRYARCATASAGATNAVADGNVLWRRADRTDCRAVPSGDNATLHRKAVSATGSMTSSE